MPRSKIEPDGWISFNDTIGAHPIMVYNKLQETGSCTRPICLVSPEEKSRIVPKDLLDRILKMFNAVDHVDDLDNEFWKCRDELNKFWPENKE